MSGAARYRRTQIAWPTIVPLAAVGALIAVVFVRLQFAAGMWLFFGVWAVVLLLFSTLTVSVDDDSLLAVFGIGLVRKRVRFATVASFSQVRNPWYYGWGIHVYPGGTLYNASGLSAIEFRMSSGRYVRIGTGEPEALAAALAQAMGKAEAGHELGGRRAWGMQHMAGAVVGALALLLVGWMFYSGLQAPDAGVTADAFSVSNGFYHSTIPLASIRTATLETVLPRIGLKTNGFGAGETLRGNFVLDEWGVSRLYINRDSPPFLVVRTVQDSYVIVNFKDPERTRALYSDLTARIDRGHR